jgi:hypothetical protein
MLCCAATATCHKVIGFTIGPLRKFTEMAFMYFTLISQMMTRTRAVLVDLLEIGRVESLKQ